MADYTVTSPVCSAAKVLYDTSVVAQPAASASGASPIVYVNRVFDDVNFGPGVFAIWETEGIPDSAGASYPHGTYPGSSSHVVVTIRGKS